MGRVTITEGIAYKHVPTGDKWVVTQVLMDNHYYVENQTAGGKARVSLADLTLAWSQEEIEFYGAYGPNAHVPFGEVVATEYTFADFSCIDEKYREVAWHRYNQILPFFALTPTQRGRLLGEEDERRPVLLDAQGRKIRQARVTVLKSDDRTRARAHSRRSRERWLRTFAQSGYDIRSLAPSVTHRAPKAGSVDDEGQDDKPTINPDPVYATLDTILVEQKLKSLPTTMGALRRDLLRQVTDKITAGEIPAGTKIPTTKTVGRYVRKKKLDWILRPRPSDVAAHGDTTAVMPGPRPDRNLARVEFDQSPLDLIVVDEDDRLPIGRATLSTGIDKHSEYAFGSHAGFEGYSFQGIRYGLLDGILPEEHPLVVDGVEYRDLSFGIPRVAGIDNGKPYIGTNMTESAGMLGMILDECHVKAPWEKGEIERFIRTNQDWVHTLPGTSFSSLMKLRMTDYDPMKDACISLSAFREMHRIFVYGIYARRPHRDLKGRAPERVWADGLQECPPDLQHRAQDVRLWLLPSEARTIQSTGVEIHCLRYQSPKLTPLRQAQPDGTLFAIKYDEADLGHIYVLDPTKVDRRTFGSWIKVTAVDPGYARGLSLYKHNVILDYAKRTAQKEEIDEYDLALAEHHIRTIVEREFRLTGEARRTRVTAPRLRGRSSGSRMWAGVDLPLLDPSEGAALPDDVAAGALLLASAAASPPKEKINGSGTGETAGEPAARSATKRKRREGPRSHQTPPTAPKPMAEVEPPIYHPAREGWGGDHALPHALHPER